MRARAKSENTQKSEFYTSSSVRQTLIGVVKEGRSALILTERVEHLEILAARLTGKAQHVVILKGGMGVKQQRELNAYMDSIPHDETRIILATGSYVGEGFDDSRLDTLFLAMPISWKGTLQQYVDRLHRLHEGKREVRVYDYVDRESLVFNAMFKKRVKGYADMGYELHTEDYQDLGIE